MVSYAERLMPAFVKRRLAAWADNLAVIGEIRDTRVLASLLPSAVRGGTRSASRAREASARGRSRGEAESELMAAASSA